MSYNLTEKSIQCKCLNSKLTSRSVIAVHIYRCFVVWCRAKETNVMAARTDFIDELL